MAALSAFGTSQDFDEFLYAPVAGESEPMPLSVLSALARLNLDPWAEATDLSNMPRETAVRRLADLIARLPAMQANKLDCAATARRLVALLPHPARRPSLPPAIAIGGLTLPRVPPRLLVMLTAAILLGAAALLLATANEQSTQDAPVGRPSSRSSLPQTL